MTGDLGARSRPCISSPHTVSRDVCWTRLTPKEPMPVPLPWWRSAAGHHFEVVVIEPRKSRGRCRRVRGRCRRAKKVVQKWWETWFLMVRVADAHHNHHDTVLSRGHAGRRVNLAYAPGARGNALGCATGRSPLRSEQDGILCISSGVLRFWFLGVYASTPQALKLHKKCIQVVHKTCNAEDAIEFETEW